MVTARRQNLYRQNISVESRPVWEGGGRKATLVGVLAGLLSLALIASAEAGRLPIPDSWVQRAELFLYEPDYVSPLGFRTTNVSCSKPDPLLLKCDVTVEHVNGAEPPKTGSTYITRVRYCEAAIGVGADGKPIPNPVGDDFDLAYAPGCRQPGLLKVPASVLSSARSLYAGVGRCSYDGPTVSCLFPDLELEIRISRPKRCRLAVSAWDYDPSARGFRYRTSLADSGVPPSRFRALC